VYQISANLLTQTGFCFIINYAEKKICCTGVYWIRLCSEYSDSVPGTPFTRKTLAS